MDSNVQPNCLFIEHVVSSSFRDGSPPAGYAGPLTSHANSDEGLLEDYWILRIAFRDAGVPHACEYPYHCLWIDVSVLADLANTDQDMAKKSSLYILSFSSSPRIAVSIHFLTLSSLKHDWRFFKTLQCARHRCVLPAHHGVLAPRCFSIMQGTCISTSVIFLRHTPWILGCLGSMPS